MRKIFHLLFIILALISCSKAKVAVSDKKFPAITLINNYEYFEGKHEFKQLGCAFLLKYKTDTFAITAKHILAILKTDSAKSLIIENFVKKWTMTPLNNENEVVVVDKLLNENKEENLKSKKIYEKDWLLFSIKENKTNVIPLEFREKPLIKGEKLFVVGWTRHMKGGNQRVYEFEFYKTKGTHYLMKKLIIPEKMGGLSGAPVVDNDGKLVGIVSISEFNLFALENMVSPVGIVELKEFLDSHLNK